jgi:hypothetical protein
MKLRRRHFTNTVRTKNPAIQKLSSFSKLHLTTKIPSVFLI